MYWGEWKGAITHFSSHCGVSSLTFVIITDLCGYLRSLLNVKGAVFNLKPITQLLETPDKSEVMKCWKGEDKQLEMILQHWLEKNDVEKDLATLKEKLKDLQGKG